MRGFNERSVLITGAGSGIGRATALCFARLGARLELVDIDATALERTAGIAGRDVAVRTHRVDVADATAMESFAARLLSAGVPDIIVNNAGIGVSGPLLDTPLEAWRRLIGVNLWGVIHGCRLFAPALVRRGTGGHIVNVASAAGFGPLRQLPAYGSSKAAVILLSEALRLELQPHGIGVSVICPGLVRTPIVETTDYVGGDALDRSRRRDAALRLYRRRGLHPDRVAASILEAVRHDRAVVPVGAEAQLYRLATRIVPRLTARIAARAPVGL